MKKIISLVLVLVLVFALAVPSFAYPHSSTQMEALNEIEYWTYWIFQDFSGYFDETNGWLTSIWQVITNSIAFDVHNMASDLSSVSSDVGTLASRTESLLNNLLDINEFTRSIDEEITSLNDNLFGNFVFLEPFAQVVQTKLDSIDSTFVSVGEDINQLKQVLADDEDLAFKESQKENQQYVQDTFFSPNSDLSLNLDKLGDFTGYVESFKTSFDFSSVGTESPLDMVSDGSDFSKWFSEDTALSVDPSYNGGSGGGGSTPEPDPDPDPEPDPDPDPEPDPDPPTSTITNLLPLATSTFGGSEIYNGKGWRENTRITGAGAYSDFNGYCATGYISITPGQNNVVYLYNITFDSSTYSRFFYYVTENGSNIQQFNPIPDENGVISISLDTYNPDIVAVRFGAKSISSDSIVTLNQYPIQTVSTFSLRHSAVSYEPEIVTSAYSDRMNEFYKLLGGDD